MPPAPLHALIHAQAQQSPESIALLSPGKQPLTYHALDGQLRATALQLRGLGLRREDRVAVVLPNGPEMAAAFLGVSSACVAAPLNPAYSADEFAFYLSDLGAKALILARGGGGAERAAAGQLGIPLIELQPEGERAGLFTLISEMPLDGAISAVELSGPADTALLLHTSGTTSRPKIVPLTDANLAFSAHNIAESYALTPADRALNLMPLFHIHGLVGVLSSSLRAGASVICTPGLRQAEIMGWLQDLRPTWFSAVPTILQAIAELAGQSQALPSGHLRFIRSASSALPPAVAQELESLFGVPVLEAYGMTEAAHQIATNPLPPRPHKFGSVGLPAGTSRVAILDESGNLRPADTMGEIAIRGENVMGGYQNNPEANLAAFGDGWLRTGDLGYVDADGYVFIRGRNKEMINRGGEKIAPREVDDVLTQHPGVEQAVAFAVPHPTLGEDVAAAVVLRKGQRVSARDLRRFAAGSLADFKVPRQIVFLAEIPKGATGKVQRMGLAERLRAELEASKTDESEGGSVPRTPVEAELAAIWQGVLGIPSIGVHDDFLALGGDSIRAVRVLAQINDRFDLVLTIRDMFDTPTIADIAGLIENPAAS